MEFVLKIVDVDEAIKTNLNYKILYLNELFIEVN